MHLSVDDCPAIVAVPAHLGSRRLPRKVLAEIGGRPMLQQVLEHCAEARGIRAVVLCTDAPELAELARDWGFPAVLREAVCVSGSERLADACAALVDLAAIPGAAPVDLERLLVLNVQADQPFLDPGWIEALHAAFCQAPSAVAVITPITALPPEQIHDPAVVKVLTSADHSRAITFSRSALPHVHGVEPQHWYQHANYWGHIGIYGYRASVLQHWRQLSVSPLETLEGLEQLRLIEAGLVVATLPVQGSCASVDTPAQLAAARQRAAAALLTKPTL